MRTIFSFFLHSVKHRQFVVDNGKPTVFLEKDLGLTSVVIPVAN